MIIDSNNPSLIYAEPGKVLKRKSDNLFFGDKLLLGFTYVINGVELDEPTLELPEHYTEVPESEYIESMLK